MKDKQRLLLGGLFFALMFFYLGVQAYFTFIHVPGGSYDGWFGEQRVPGGPVRITGADPEGPATALKAGDEFLAINGITPAEDPEIMGFSNEVPPGTTFLMTVRRDNQELVIPITTVEMPARHANFAESVYIFVQLIFLMTGLAVFLLKPGDPQAWLLALMLGTFIGLSTSTMPLAVLGRGTELLVSFAKILSLWSLPLFVRFFLNFPERSPILRRWPKLEAYLNWPFYLFVLPYFGGGRLPPDLGAWYFNLPPVKWLNDHSWFGLPMPVLAAYLVAGLVCLVVNYRAAGLDARRRLRVIVIGSGAAVLTILVVIGAQLLGVSDRTALDRWLEISLLVTLPFIPLSFAYAIIRHKVIPVSLIIRRSARYVLVSRGSIVLEVVVVFAALTFFLTTFFNYLRPSSGIVIGVISGVVAVVVWNVFSTLHRRVIAPVIDRRFFREAYDAQSILAELAQAVRTVTGVEQLLELVAVKLQQALHAENVLIFLRDARAGDYACSISVEYKDDVRAGVAARPEFVLPHDSFVAARLRRSAEALTVDFTDLASWVHGAGATTDADGAARETLRRINSALLLPLVAKDRVLGLVSLGPRLGDLPYSGEDERLLMSVAGQTSLSLANARLVEQMIEEGRRRQEVEAENERRAKELEEARSLQLSMLPKRVPRLPGLEIAAYMKPATEVGGDYYDFDVGEDGTLTVAVGDATGHGLRAGTMVTAMKSLFNTHAQERDITHIFRQTSGALKRMNLRSLYMAMTMIKICGSELRVSAAGMPPVLIYRARAGRVEEVAIKAMPLGSVASFPYKEEKLSLSSDDVIVLMSDGFAERFNAAGEMLDYATANLVLEQVAARTPQEIIEHFVETGESWAGGRPQDDDVTFVVVKVRDGR